jgi:hypothetical protein
LHRAPVTCRFHPFWTPFPAIPLPQTSPICPDGGGAVSSSRWRFPILSFSTAPPFRLTFLRFNLETLPAASHSPSVSYARQLSERHFGTPSRIFPAPGGETNR